MLDKLGPNGCPRCEELFPVLFSQFVCGDGSFESVCVFVAREARVCGVVCVCVLCTRCVCVLKVIPGMIQVLVTRGCEDTKHQRHQHPGSHLPTAPQRPS